MKPDGKIQGVDVWVRELRLCKNCWIITDHFSETGTFNWLSKAGELKKQYDTSRDDICWPTREAALTHLRELEAKERPVIDLSTAKFGDMFKRADGIEKYACPMDGKEGWHVMQSGRAYTTTGRWASPGVPHPFDLVAPYAPPRTREVWVEWWERTSGEGDFSVYASEHEKQKGLAHSAKCGHKTLATKKLTLTEGEGLAEPDVA